MKNYEIGEIVFVDGELCRVVSNTNSSKLIRYDRGVIYGYVLVDSQETNKITPYKLGYGSLTRYNPKCHDKKAGKKMG